MVLVIDVGNSFVKTAVYNDNSQINFQILDATTIFGELEKLLQQFAKINTVVIASVGTLDFEDFKAKHPQILFFMISILSKFPFQNLYTTPATLGIDRMVLAAGAVFQFPKKNRLIIDAGTCVTYDFVDENNNYLGGAISPGIRLRYEALHQHTSKLPFLRKEIPESSIGNSTNKAIHSGVVNGIGFEIEGFVSDFKLNFKNFIIILTGGDADFLAKQLKKPIFANSNFLVESLNQLFQYNSND